MLSLAKIKALTDELLRGKDALERVAQAMDFAGKCALPAELVALERIKFSAERTLVSLEIVRNQVDIVRFRVCNDSEESED